MQKIAKEHWFLLTPVIFLRRTGQSPLKRDGWKDLCDTKWLAISWYLQQLAPILHLELYGFGSDGRYLSFGIETSIEHQSPWCFGMLTEILSSTQIEMLKAIANGEQHFSTQAVKRQTYNLFEKSKYDWLENRKILQNKGHHQKSKRWLFAFVDPIYPPVVLRRWSIVDRNYKI